MKIRDPSLYSGHYFDDVFPPEWNVSIPEWTSHIFRCWHLCIFRKVVCGEEWRWGGSAFILQCISPQYLLLLLLFKPNPITCNTAALWKFWKGKKANFLEAYPFLHTSFNYLGQPCSCSTSGTQIRMPEVNCCTKWHSQEEVFIFVTSNLSPRLLGCWKMRLFKLLHLPPLVLSYEAWVNMYIDLSR